MSLLSKYLRKARKWIRKQDLESELAAVLERLPDSAPELAALLKGESLLNVMQRVLADYAKRKGNV